MAAGDSVPLNRPGDVGRRITDLEDRLRELRSALSMAIPVGFATAATAANVVISPAGRITPPLTVSAVVPVGMTRMTAFCGLAVSGVNGTTVGDGMNAAIRLNAVTTAATALPATVTATGLTQSLPVTMGGRGQLTVVRADSLTGVTPGATVTYSALVWTDTGSWPADPRTVLDLEVSIVWFA